MLTAKLVKTWVKGNDLFSAEMGVANRVEQNGDVFVPSAHMYPHVHIGKNFVVWSKTDKNHSYLIEGALVYKPRIAQALSSTTDFGTNQLLRYMNSQA